jgi:hypothetical protein
MVSVADDNSGRTLPPGTEVEVRNRFNGDWTSGFEVADVGPGAIGPRPAEYWLRRISDGTKLAPSFSPSEVRLRRSAI